MTIQFLLPRQQSVILNRLQDQEERAFIYMFVLGLLACKYTQLRLEGTLTLFLTEQLCTKLNMIKEWDNAPQALKLYLKEIVTYSARVDVSC